MNWKVIAGIMLITMGVGLFLYYDRYVRPEREAREMIAEARLIFERGDESGDKDSINQAISLFSKVIARYPETKAIPEAYFLTGKCYEKLKLYRLAYLKYSYLAKDTSGLVTPEMKKDVLVRLAHINVLKQYSEEGIHQLYSLLNTSSNQDFRGRIYTELGHTYLKLGQYGRAKRMFDISLQESGSNQEALLGKARAYKRMGYDEDAYNLYEYFLKYYGAVSQYTGDVRMAYREQAYRSGLSAFRRGHYSRAIGFFNRVLRNFPFDSRSEYSLYWIGESYYGMKSFDTAISYFNRVLSNSYYQKDQDAQIKKGYAYFLTKRFDLAAREFQRYMRNYPNGKYANIASEWKNMSTKELLYRIQSQKVPKALDEDKEERSDDADDEDLVMKKDSSAGKGDDDEEVSGKYDKGVLQGGDERPAFENVAEL